MPQSPRLIESIPSRSPLPGAGRGRSIAAVVASRWVLLVFIAAWFIGAGALATVVGSERKETRATQALLSIENVQSSLSHLSQATFAPALLAATERPAAGAATLDLDVARRHLARAASTLEASISQARYTRFDSRVQAYLPELAHVSTLVRRGSVLTAAAAFGSMTRPGGSLWSLTATMQAMRADARATQSYARAVGTISVITTFAAMLLAFSLAIHRTGRLAREKHDLLELSRVEARTDALTGLPNRRSLFTDMEDILAHPPAHGKLALGMLDLDGFKSYNDTFGHPAGDALLVRLGDKLSTAMHGRGLAYRMGGDEFCVIVIGDDPERVLSDAAEALSEQGELFHITCSLGSVAIASPEMTLKQALHHADQRLYQNKSSTRIAAGGEAYDVLLRVLSESSFSLATHMTTVGMLAEAVARTLGLSDVDVKLTRLAAELHDVGKAAIPDAILDKPGPLDIDEWEIMKQHTIIGERILAAAPGLAAVAPLVRSSHERPDGSGYPDGLQAAEIAIASSIVSVVDAYDAMTSSRPYDAPLPHAEAIDELRRCAGTQFDEIVVEAFISVCLEPSLDTSRHYGATDLRSQVYR